MTSATVYFVTALILTTYTPALGWLQYYERSYALVEVCEEHVVSKREAIIVSLRAAVGNTFIGILDIQCMTYDNAVRENTKLGH